MRMRSILLLSLLSLAFGLTVLSLFAVHSSLQTQIRGNLAADLSHSTVTFENLQRHRQQLLDREVALLADLPSLKSLMTSGDARTIQDGGSEFWKVSGSDLFALLDASGAVTAVYDNAGAPARQDLDPQLKRLIDSQPEQRYIFSNHRLYQVSFHPLVFGSESGGTPLGFVIAGYAVNDEVGREVREATAADVIFLAGNEIISSTLPAKHDADLKKQAGTIAVGANQDLWLGKEHYLANSRNLPALSRFPVTLLVLKSYDQASSFLRRLNRLLMALGLLVLFVGTMMALYLSSTITRPLDELVVGARALGSGNFDYQFTHGGAKELIELRSAFDHMRNQVRRSQQEMVESARLAIIGRMASSISHDLRHYLSAIYANSEFLVYPGIPPSEREELLEEIKHGVQGMTDVLESLLIFSRTGRSLHPTCEALHTLVERAVGLIRMHPDAHSVTIFVDPLPQIEVWLDARMMERAICNLLINAVQAAKVGTPPGWVRVNLIATARLIELRITDNGLGVPESIREILFEPFVSDGKKSGIGLGLTIANRIAEEHGGAVRLEDSHPGRTTFVLSLPKSILESLGMEGQNRSTSLMS